MRLAIIAARVLPMPRKSASGADLRPVGNLEYRHEQEDLHAEINHRRVRGETTQQRARKCQITERKPLITVIDTAMHNQPASRARCGSPAPMNLPTRTAAAAPKP